MNTPRTPPQWPPDYIFISRWGRIKLVSAMYAQEDDPDIVSLRVDPETRKYLPSMPADLTLEQWSRRKEERSKGKEEANWDINIHFTSHNVDNNTLTSSSPRHETDTKSPAVEGSRATPSSLSPPQSKSSSFVGVCGIFRIDRENKSGDVGILIRPELYRNYIATEALYCNLVLAFEHPQLELYRVSFITAAMNVRMRGWLERFDIALEYRMKEAWSDGKGGRLDVAVYTILKPDWPALKDKLKEELDKRLLKH